MELHTTKAASNVVMEGVWSAHQTTSHMKLAFTADTTTPNSSERRATWASSRVTESHLDHHHHQLLLLVHACDDKRWKSTAFLICAFVNVDPSTIGIWKIVLLLIAMCWLKCKFLFIPEYQIFYKTWETKGISFVFIHLCFQFYWCRP